MTATIPIFCANCGATGAVEHVTSALMCRCGSTDLGLLGVDPRPATVKQAAPQGPGTGWSHPHPNPTVGWNEYTGPTPGFNPMPVKDPAQRWPCANCQGSGYDLIDKTRCKACKGTGQHTPPTSIQPPMDWDATPAPHRPGGAGQRPASFTTASTVGPTILYAGGAGGTASNSTSYTVTVPAPKSPSTARTAPATATLALTASCPRKAAHGQTLLAPDYRQHAWWCCAKCGGLADLDEHPNLDPFDPPGSLPRGRMRTRAKRGAPQDGRILTVMAAIAEHNEVSTQEALGLARNTIQRYGRG